MPKAASPVVSAQERLAIRISNMINTPKAQMQRRVVIHRLDSEPDEAWEAVMEGLSETEGLDMVFNDDGTVTLSWRPHTEEGAVVPVEELDPVNSLF